ncbi:lysosomal alpha-glucosidase-like protein [Leptotrombidium deliense]|uniref:Lysosomal alpha-glucosidase-like protein n=1 Tax=Leptotrombidium deliense TaxID=299467 RepID=A0A443S874_9ACAR|nr:lysosomal alpha-glucosidase-like protein [Leptotrombidium deliense]
MRGGSVFVTSEKILQTSELTDKRNKFNLIVILDENNKAEGDFFWDDGDSVDSIHRNEYNYVTFSAKNHSLSIQTHKDGYKVEKFMRSIHVYGVTEHTQRVTVNGQEAKFAYFDKENWLIIFYEGTLFSSYFVNSTFHLPTCFFPNDYEGYKIEAVTKDTQKIIVKLRRVTHSGLPRDIINVTVNIEAVSGTLCRIRVTDSNNNRFEPKLPKLNIPEMSTPMQYSFDLNPSGILSVTAKSTGNQIFVTDLRRLIFSDQFIQLESKLPSKYLYGLGEHKDSFRKIADWKVYTMMNFDHSPTFNSALYGSHPFYLTLDENSAQSSGIFIFNTNPMDIGLTPAPSIVYRPIGGILDLFVFVGNSPDLVVSDYIKLIGLPSMPPLWGLGFQLCRWGYNSLDKTIQVWSNTRNAKIPFDVQWNDIDYMDSQNDFTYNQNSYAGLPEFVDLIHKLGMHYVMIIDPGISAGEKPGTYLPYEEGKEMDIFIKNSTGQILIGRVWNKSGKTVFPDFTNPNATEYWFRQLYRFHSQVAFDGAWIDMNEISDFVDGSLYGCPNNELENPPYVPGNQKLQKNGLCMSAKHYAGVQYNVHNLYSTYQTKVTNEVLKKLRDNKRPFIISRSTFSGQGHFGGHWSGDVSSTFEDMAYSIPCIKLIIKLFFNFETLSCIAILNFNMFGTPLVGADICGFGGDTTVELCARWMALGAFYPFSRNHNANGQIDQDPVSLGPTVVKASINALQLRYEFLPYLYTLFYRAHIFGETVARPLFFVYPNDQIARKIETQFMWGSGLMIAPVLQANVREIDVYLPAGHWYHMLTNKLIKSSGEFMKFSAPIDAINVFMRESSVFVVAEPTLQTSELADKAIRFNLVAILDENNNAEGDFFWDDGDSVDSIETNEYNYVTFSVPQNNSLSIVTHNYGYEVEKLLELIHIFGVTEQPHRVTINGNDTKFMYFNDENRLTIFNGGIIFSKYLIVWQ